MEFEVPAPGCVVVKRSCRNSWEGTTSVSISHQEEIWKSKKVVANAAQRSAVSMLREGRRRLRAALERARPEMAKELVDLVDPLSSGSISSDGTMVQ
ncbi:MAG: hypothetical protein QME92_05475 [Bacillota bacterium]|nr:hypothetical protein [Bacillota bacterium]